MSVIRYYPNRRDYAKVAFLNWAKVDSRSVSYLKNLSIIRRKSFDFTSLKEKQHFITSVDKFPMKHKNIFIVSGIYK